MELRNSDFPAALILRDGLPVPKARLFTESLLATAALAGENSPPAVATVNLGLVGSL